MSTEKKPAKRVSAKTICRKVIKVPGINSRTGRLLKGWHYVNGKPAKVKPAPKKKATTVKKSSTTAAKKKAVSAKKKTTSAKKKITAKKAAPKKKGFSIFG